jgi:hypothetical protein
MSKPDIRVTNATPAPSALVDANLGLAHRAKRDGQPFTVSNTSLKG